MNNFKLETVYPDQTRKLNEQHVWSLMRGNARTVKSIRRGWYTNFTVWYECSSEQRNMKVVTKVLKEILEQHEGKMVYGGMHLHFENFTLRSSTWHEQAIAVLHFRVRQEAQ